MSRLVRSPSRQGSSSVEFALVFSMVLFPLLIGTVEAGVYVHQIDAAADAVVVAGRAAAGVALEDDPAATFDERMAIELSERGIMPSPVMDNMLLSSSISGESPERMLDVEVQFDYGGIIGILPTPDHVRVKRRFRLEDQVEYGT